MSVKTEKQGVFGNRERTSVKVLTVAVIASSTWPPFTTLLSYTNISLLFNCRRRRKARVASVELNWVSAADGTHHATSYTLPADHCLGTVAPLLLGRVFPPRAEP